jgi:AcrR family transcriptional regulator
MGEENPAEERKETRPGKSGRAAFVPGAEDRERVARMFAGGAKLAVIAEAVGISVPTLRKAFAAELADRIGPDNLFTAASEAAPPAAPDAKRKTGRTAGGRRRHAPNDRHREKVAILAAAGMSEMAIAAAVGISAPTLRRHYASELEIGPAVKRAEVVTALYRTAIGGNVAAQKAVLEIFDRASLEAMDNAFTGTPADLKPERLGKKEQAQRDADEAATESDWADLLRDPSSAPASDRLQ